MNTNDDFYVENGCCTSCGMPQVEAPDLFTYDVAGHCYVRRQPSTASEYELMANAMDVQELGCIRYKGANQKIITLLRQRGLAEYVDKE